MKKILLIGTGGTIACVKGPEGLRPAINVSSLVEYVPECKEFCQVSGIQLMNLDSTNMEPKHWIMMAECIRDHYDVYDGFVICHGTDTMAYTAASLSYLIQNSEKPIVVTGAQRPIDVENTDARTNLLDSLHFVCHEKAYGVNVVFGGKVMAGTRAKKERSKSYNAFSSINFPYIATIYEDKVLIYFDDKASVAEPVRFYHSLNTKVGVLKLIPSMPVSILNEMANQFDAVIIESFGVGGLPSYEDNDFYQAVCHWAEQGKVFLMATQVVQEGSNLSIYEVGKKVKEAPGVMEIYDMTLEAAVTKLMWILGQTKDKAEIERLFYTKVNHDIMYKKEGE